MNNLILLFFLILIKHYTAKNNDVQSHTQIYSDYLNDNTQWDTNDIEENTYGDLPNWLFIFPGIIYNSNNF